MGTENQIYRYISERLSRGIYIYMASRTFNLQSKLYLSRKITRNNFTNIYYFF